MQAKYLRGHKSHQLNGVCVSPNDAKAKERWEALKRFELGMEQGLSSHLAARVAGVPRSTVYRWKKQMRGNLLDLKDKSKRPKRMRQGKDKRELSKRILELREQYPTWGKRKVWKLLVREGRCVSESTVGRLISGLLKKDLILSAKLKVRPHEALGLQTPQEYLQALNLWVDPHSQSHMY